MVLQNGETFFADLEWFLCLKFLIDFDCFELTYMAVLWYGFRGFALSTYSVIIKFTPEKNLINHEYAFYFHLSIFCSNRLD